MACPRSTLCALSSAIVGAAQCSRVAQVSGLRLVTADVSVAVLLRRAAVLAFAAAAVPATTYAAPAPLQIRTLSKRAHLIPDGIALVAITLPRAASARALKVAVGGRDISSPF